MIATVASSSPAAVAGQWQYTSGKTNTSEKRVSQSQSKVGAFLEASQAHYNVDEEAPRTPGLYWDSDASSDASVSPNMRSFFEDWEDAPSEPSCSVETEDDGSQVVTIRPFSPFYLPHALPRPFDFMPFSDPAFPHSFPSTDGEEALFQKYLAQESSYKEPIEPAVPALRDSVVVVDFSDSPLEIFDGISFETGWYMKHGEDVVPENWPSDVKSGPDSCRDIPTRAVTL